MAGNLSHLSVIRALLDKYSFSFSKQLGQNFLINPSVCPRMAEEGGAGPGVGVLEIGPGFGVLTRELAVRAEKVVAIELDQRLLPVLNETLAEFKNVHVHIGDVLKVDLLNLIRDELFGMEVVVCANLPYYITSPVLMSLLESRLPVSAITVMVQKEAADRICAKPGTRQAGAVSIAVRYYAQPRMLFPVSRGSFFPAPNVDSAVIRLDVRGTPPVSVRSERHFFAVVKAAFGQRRKTLGNAVGAGLSLPKPRVIAALKATGQDEKARAEQLTLEQFARLSDALLDE